MSEQSTFPFEEPEKNSLLKNTRLKRPLVIFDLETTGLDFDLDRIVQFAFLRVSPDGSQREWTDLVNPDMPIPPEATDVHGISDSMVRNQPPFAYFAPLIKQFIENCDLSGYNIKSFDVPFLQAEFKRYGDALELANRNIIDAKIIFHRKEPRDLAAALEFYCGKEHQDAHDALGDVRATLDILDAQLERYPDVPKSMDDLNEFCSTKDVRYVTADRKFMWRYNGAVINFGKHRGRSLEWLVENDRDYLIWISDSEFSDETKAIVKAALQGRFPRRDKI